MHTSRQKWPHTRGRIESIADLKARTEEGPGGCWLWQLSTGTAGYGQTGFRGRIEGAHRVAYILSHGGIPAGGYVLHSCDNRLCCNPAHLRLGDHRANMRDMAARDRSLRGERGTRAKLTPDAVRAIRASRETQTALAARYGVSQNAISKAKRRVTWWAVQDLNLRPADYESAAANQLS